MASAEVYKPELWTNFFVLVGTGSAALTGLVFVAISAPSCSTSVPSGIYISAIALIINFCFLVSGSWLLIVGTLHSANETPI